MKWTRARVSDVGGRSEPNAYEDVPTIGERNVGERSEPLPYPEVTGVRLCMAYIKQYETVSFGM